jgi:hypothetical protein
MSCKAISNLELPILAWLSKSTFQRHRKSISFSLSSLKIFPTHRSSVTFKEPKSSISELILGMASQMGLMWRCR